MSVEDLLLKRELMACTWWPIVWRSCWCSWSGWLPLLVTIEVILGVFLEGKEFWATVFHKAEIEDIKICFDPTFFLIFAGGSMAFHWKHLADKYGLGVICQLTCWPDPDSVHIIKILFRSNAVLAKTFYLPNIVWFLTKRPGTTTKSFFSVFDNSAITPLFTFKLIVYFYGMCWTNVWQPNGF